MHRMALLALWGIAMSTAQAASEIFELFPVNITFFRLINDHHHPWLDAFFTRYLYLGKGWFLLPVLVGVFLWRRRASLLLLVTVAIETALVVILKQCHQPRPAALLDDVHLLDPLLKNSFPSGDVAMACAIAGVCCCDTPRSVRVLALTYAALIAYERIYVGAHFPLDVLAGALIGFGAAWLASRITALRSALRPAPVVRTQQSTPSLKSPIP